MSTKSPGRRELRSFLQQFSKEQLIDQIVDLVGAFPSVRDYYHAKARPAEDSAVRSKYKTIIWNEFFPRSGFGKGRLSVARKAVTDYKKVAASADGVADIMLHYVETGVEFTVDLGDINESFYLSMERMFETLLKHLREHGLLNKFKPRCAAVVRKTSGIGWGFHDTLSDLYAEEFGMDL